MKSSLRSAIPIFIAVALAWMLFFKKEVAQKPEALTSALPQSITVCFTPGMDCAGQVVSAIGNAKQEIRVQAYSFTSAPIAQALVEAHQRGVDVQVLLDDSQESEKYSSLTFLKNQGIPTLVDSSHAIAHNKIMIFDGASVLTGSFNFTKSAQEKNAENLLLIQDPNLAKPYLDNWKKHEQHSRLPQAPGIKKTLPKSGKR